MINDQITKWAKIDSVKTTITDNTGGEYWTWEYPFYWTPPGDSTDIPCTSGYLRCDENIKNTEVFEMQVYNVIVIDTKECEVVEHYPSIVAENEKMAMLELHLGETITKMCKKGQIAFIFTLLG